MGAKCWAPRATPRPVRTPTLFTDPALIDAGARRATWWPVDLLAAVSTGCVSSGFLRLYVARKAGRSESVHRHRCSPLRFLYASFTKERGSGDCVFHHYRRSSKKHLEARSKPGEHLCASAFWRVNRGSEAPAQPRSNPDSICEPCDPPPLRRGHGNTARLAAAAIKYRRRRDVMPGELGHNGGERSCRTTWCAELPY